ncbi:MAG TPA: DNA polymerase III subunit beta [Phycisphaerales bacterium]|nr:DNA polymerase III subunit beta [Phycisphaerales bacterium]
MKVICDRAALLEAINLVSGAVAQRSPRPQLGCVRLTASKASGAGDLTLSATDAEVALKLTMTQVDVQKTGEALIPADRLRAIISAEEGEPTLTIEVENDVCHIKGADAHFKVFGYPVNDFPPIPEFADVVSGKMDAPKARSVLTHPAGSLASLVQRTLFATARENSRYAINGVLLKRDGKRLEMVATDGRRLALARAALTGGEKDAKGVTCIVPTKALNMLLKLVQGHDEPVQIAITDAQILFSFGTAASPGRAVLVSNLVEGTFPPYEDVIPKDHDKKVSFDRDVVSSAVRRAALLTNEESRGVRMIFKAKDKKLELTSRAAEVGEAQVRVDLAGYEGEDLEIGFNPQFITDALKVIPETEVIMEFKAGNKPGLMRSGNDFMYVVMPVSLQ